VPALLFSCSNGIIREKVTETLKGSHELHALLLITRNSFFFWYGCLFFFLDAYTTSCDFLVWLILFLQHELHALLLISEKKYVSVKHGAMRNV
jgi:hypothetical protein